MAKKYNMISFSIDVTKIDKSKLVTGKKGLYCDITGWINEEETDQYGNNFSVHLSQSKEERDSGTPRVYLGNGKAFKYLDQTGNLQSRADRGSVQEKEEEEDLPF